MTVAEIAAVFKLNPQTIRNSIDHGTLSALRIGRRARVKRGEFEQLLTNAPRPARSVPRAAVYTAAQFWDGESHPPPTAANSRSRPPSAA